MEGSTPKIILAEDVEALRHAIAYELGDSGYKVIEAKNAPDAIEALARNKDARLILSDVRMPGGTGVELVQHVRSLDPFNPPLIFISAFSDLRLEDALDLGAEAMFPKPFDTDELLTAVRRSLQNHAERWQSLPTTTAREHLTKQFLKVTTQVGTAGDLIAGHGGVFVAQDKDLAKTNQVYDFHFDFEGGPIRTLEGRGIVRWSRLSIDDAVRSGYGLEFIHLRPQCIDPYLKLLRQEKTKAFIPLGRKQ